MSDFSAAYHLKTNDVQDVLNLFKRAELIGYVFKPINGWVSFVTKFDNFRSDVRVTDLNLGTLLFFERTNDFLGWGFEIFENSKLIGKYSIESDDEENLKIINTLDSDALSKIAEISKIDSVLSILNPIDFESAYDNGDFEFAKLIGLVNVEWISFHQIDRNIEDYEIEKIGFA